MFRLKPIFKDYIWGGDKLTTYYNKKSIGGKIAESWELCMHPDGTNTILDREHKDMTISQLAEIKGKSIYGDKCRKHNYFPIMVKLIDAYQDLSIQVHPNDEYALKNEGQLGKTEMWVVLECEESAHIYCGFNRKVDKEEFLTSLLNGDVTKLLNKFFVKKGDVFFIEPGTVHTIGKGIVIAEIQQNSNVTYRVYDYDRTDIDGNKRELHIDKAMDVINFDRYGKELLLDSNLNRKLFDVEKFLVDKTANFSTDKDSFVHILILEGKGKIKNNSSELKIIKGDSIFLPAQECRYFIEGKLEVLATKIV